ncbi:hypothetical protein LX36DRAFT_669568 [Colletotrichum falcatum]|nr:hypothetical protein LX36DRAFT_669568 [Colletotrichum falcatum]
MFDTLRMTIGVFRYINHPDALPTVQLAPLRDAVVIHREFDSNWYREGADRTRVSVKDRILDVREAFSRLEEDDESRPNAPVVGEILDDLDDQLDYMKPPLNI